MATVEILSTISEKITFDADDYYIKISKKQLFKFYKKIEDASPDAVKTLVKQFVDDKKKSKNNYYLDEIRDRNIELLSTSIIRYCKDEITYLSEDECDDSQQVVKTYTIEEPDVKTDREQLDREEEEVEKDDKEINL
jgi:hypothetical protein